MLKTNFLGLELRNPLIVSAGPWNRNGQSMAKSIKAGAGAVVTESVVSDTLVDVRPRIACDNMGAQNIRLYSELQIEDWEREIDYAKEAGGVVIGSVSAQTSSELAYLACKMEKFGCDAIELSVSNPAKESLEVVASHPDIVHDMTKEVASSVKVPVMVKLSQNTTNIAKVAKAVKSAGGAGVSAINTVRGILGVDLENGVPTLSTYGGISGEYIRPLGLASVATIAQTVDIPICGIGGVSSGKNVLEYMMLGASVVQMGTTVMLEGYDSVTRVVEELEQWISEHDIDNIDQIKGRALQNMKSFDEMKYAPVVCSVESVACEAECNKCENICAYGAVSRSDDSVVVNRDNCTGCGLCTYSCPSDKLKLSW